MNLQKISPFPIRQRPYSLLLLTGLVFVLTSFFMLKSGDVVDIHLHDTYFVIAHAYIYRLLAISAFVLWAFYLLTYKTLYSKMLTWAHVITTILTLAVLALIAYFGNRLLHPAPPPYYDLSPWQASHSGNKYIHAVTITLFILVFGQVIFVINLIAGLVKRT
jgi:heme/copper-type cytochrome/quinol oxidase subunit 1